MTNPKRQTSRASMEDILSSIRRIIDESVPETPLAGAAPTSPVNLNGSTTRTAMAMDPLAPNQMPLREPKLEKPPVPTTELSPKQKEEPVVPAYDDRFTADDAEAFREVAQVLQSTATMLNGSMADGLSEPVAAPDAAPEHSVSPQESLPLVEPARNDEPLQPATETTEERKPSEVNGLGVGQIMPLVSHEASRSIAETFSTLDDVFRAQTGEDLKATTEELLRPMLAEWLDENLPSMVERLVRQEIERIARGEPRAA